MTALPRFFARAALVAGHLEVAYPLPDGILAVADAALVEITVPEGGRRVPVMMLCPRSGVSLVATLIPPGSSSRILSTEEALAFLHEPCRLMFICPAGSESGVTLNGRPLPAPPPPETRGDA